MAWQRTTPEVNATDKTDMLWNASEEDGNVKCEEDEGSVTDW